MAKLVTAPEDINFLGGLLAAAEMLHALPFPVQARAEQGDEAAQEWLNQFAHIPLDDRQRLALVYLRYHKQLTNRDYRRLNHVDAMVAGQELRGLVQADLVEQHSASRWTYYTLKAAGELTEQKAHQTEEEKILAYVREHGTINNAQCRELLGVDLKPASYLLQKLTAEGALKQEGKRRWAHYRLP